MPVSLDNPAFHRMIGESTDHIGSQAKEMIEELAFEMEAEDIEGTDAHAIHSRMMLLLMSVQTALTREIAQNKCQPKELAKASSAILSHILKFCSQFVAEKDQREFLVTMCGEAVRNALDAEHLAHEIVNFQ